MEKIKDRPNFRVYAAAIDDVLKFENASLVVDSDIAYVAETKDGTLKCLFDGIDGFMRFYDKIGTRDKLMCVYNMPLDFPTVTGIKSDACVTYAYFDAMPPVLRGDADIRRLAPSLAQTVAERYRNKNGAFPVEHVEELMRDKGVFGAIEGGALAGFIGRHSDGSMGMLDVDTRFRRRGLGEQLQKFMMNYIMTFGRVPLCDVYIDNVPSVNLQKKTGMTPAPKYTFWFNSEL